jgi:hypothetical protein
MRIARDFYLQRLRKVEGNGLVKVITGVRRCGKSFLLFTLCHETSLRYPSKRDAIGTAKRPAPKRAVDAPVCRTMSVNGPGASRSRNAVRARSALPAFADGCLPSLRENGNQIYKTSTLCIRPQGAPRYDSIT